MESFFLAMEKETGYNDYSSAYWCWALLRRWWLSELYQIFSEEIGNLHIVFHVLKGLLSRGLYSEHHGSMELFLWKRAVWIVQQCLVYSSFWLCTIQYCLKIKQSRDFTLLRKHLPLVQRALGLIPKSYKEKRWIKFR